MNKIRNSLLFLLKYLESIDTDELNINIKINDKTKRIIIYMFLLFIVFASIILVELHYIDGYLNILLIPIIILLFVTYIYPLLLIPKFLFTYISICIIKSILWITNVKNIIKIYKNITPVRLLIACLVLLAIHLFDKQIMILLRYILNIIYIILSILNSILELITPERYK